MRRFLLACSLVTSLVSPALADQRFARPVAPHVAVADAKVVADAGADVVIDRAAVRAKLAKQRAANVKRFRAYQANGIFPSNTYLRRSLNVWIDEQGRLCAAATIIQFSGHAALVQQVADTNNFIRLSDVTDGALMDWILTSGLTQAELAAIQEPFMGVAEEPREPQLAVDPQRRRDEDARLRAKYREVEASIVKSTAASLDAATDRLMAHPQLAQRWLAK